MEVAEQSPLRKYVPSGKLARAAFYLALEALPAPILNHSLRTFLFTKWLAEREGDPYATEYVDVLFVACLFHDFGATETHNHDERFEVCGGDAAVRFMKEYLAAEAQERIVVNTTPASVEQPPMTPTQVWDVWTAIALHTSPGIAERIHPLARLIRLGVLLDFRQATRVKLEAVEFGKQVDDDVPRLEIEKVLGDAVVKQAMSKQEGDARNQKAPAASWAGVLLRSHLEDPSWDGVNRAF